MKEHTCQYKEPSKLTKRIITGLWTLMGALFFSIIVYFVGLYNSQFVTADELKPLEQSVIESNLKFKHIDEKLNDIKSDLKTLKEKL